MEGPDEGVSRAGPPEAVRGHLSQASPPAAGELLAILGVPWLVEAPPGLCFHLHKAFSVCVCSVSPFSKDTCHVALGAHPNDRILV